MAAGEQLTPPVGAATFRTELVDAAPAAIARAAALIGEGFPVAVPSETVYGLAGDARSGEAVARIYAAKGRPSFNPLIVHVADIEAAARMARLPAVALRIAEACWPGPLTIVAPLRPDAGIAGLTTAGLDTVAVRVPAHPVMRALIAACGRPLAAPSANASGAISPTRAEHVLRSLGGRIPMIIDGGATAHGLESTVVRIVGDTLHLLRPGPIDAAGLEALTGLPVIAAGDVEVRSPGQLASHYAPRKPLRLNATAALPGETLIGFGPVAGDLSLSIAGDPIEAAARLFDLLHMADDGAGAAIAVAPIPETGVGAAINDRLRRAATR